MSLNNKIGVLFLVPATFVLLVFVFFPIALTVYYSFTNVTLSGITAVKYSFIGFRNFSSVLGNFRFYISVYNTLIFLFSSILGQQVLGFLLALLMRKKNPCFRRFVGLSVLSGWVCPEIVAAFAWLAFLDKQGTFNTILGFLHLSPVPWLFQFAMLSVIVVNIWRGTAFSMLVFQSALDHVPDSIEEAAHIDGASPFQRLFLVVIPSIKETIITNTILVTLQTLGVFGLIYALTGGGPGMKTQTLPIFIYNEAFVGYQIGYGTAISLFLLLFGATLSVLYIRSAKALL